MVKRIEPTVGQRSVWDFPRPPLLEPISRRVRIEFGGRMIADSTRSLWLLETSHPPVYYVPPDDVDLECFQPTEQSSFCEFKGMARYYDIHVGARCSANAAWSYDSPSVRYAALKGYLAFYAQEVDACFVDDEKVIPQPGMFYGGWITSDIVGPFKGGVGSSGW